MHISYIVASIEHDQCMYSADARCAIAPYSNEMSTVSSLLVHICMFNEIVIFCIRFFQLKWKPTVCVSVTVYVWCWLHFIIFHERRQAALNSNSSANMLMHFYVSLYSVQH